MSEAELTVNRNHYETIVLGGGPAGLSAALNLVRSRRKTIVLDGNRPRHSATMLSHGFLTRDGTPPSELRRMGREEYLNYPGAEYQLCQVTTVTRDADGRWQVAAKGINGHPDQELSADVLLLATGLREQLPELPSIRNYYGMSLFSCIECDGFELSDRSLALIGETSDLAWRAISLKQWTDRLSVFTNGTRPLTERQEEILAERGIALYTEKIDDLVGDRTLEGVRLIDGRVIPVSGGFVRPRWVEQLDYLEGIQPEVDAWGLLKTDRDGRTSIPGLYAAGDLTSPGPQQLIVAAGAGARTAATIHRDLIDY
ncbi:MAG: NAD(P)/FAD-dependent oxidoreductase [Microbacteriaceae bacterium]